MTTLEPLPSFSVPSQPDLTTKKYVKTKKQNKMLLVVTIVLIVLVSILAMTAINHIKKKQPEENNENYYDVNHLVHGDTKAKKFPCRQFCGARDLSSSSDSSDEEPEKKCANVTVTCPTSNTRRLVDEETGDSLAKQNASIRAGNLMRELVARYELTGNTTLRTADEIIIREVMITFDDDSNGVLDSDEFTNFLFYTSSYPETFNFLDIDNDGILSFSEYYTFIQAYMNQVGGLDEAYIELLQPGISALFNYTFNQQDALSYEYATSILFEVFDPGYKGYITLDDIKTNGGLKSYDVVNFATEQEITESEFRLLTFSAASIIRIADNDLLGNIYFDQELDSFIDEAFLIETAFTLETCPIPLTNRSNCTTTRVIPQRRRTQEVNNQCECDESRVTCAANFLLSVACCSGTIDNNCASCYLPTSSVCSQSQIECGTNFFTITQGPGLAGCFGVTNNVVTIRVVQNDELMRKQIPLKDLKVGDLVESRDKNNNLIWSKVWHINEHYGEFNMLNIKYYYNGNYGNIILTGHHLIYINDFKLIRADELIFNDYIIISKDNHFIKAKVSKISIYKDNVARSPFTMNGDIVISSVLASSYTKSPQNAQFLHKAGTIFRKLSYFDTKLASDATHFFYFYVFKTIKYLGFEQMAQHYMTVPVISVMPIIIAIATIKLKNKF